MPDRLRASYKVHWSSRKRVERGYHVLRSQKIGLSGNTGNAGHGLKMVRNTIEEEEEEEEKEEEMIMMMMRMVRVMMMMMMMVVVKMFKNQSLLQCWKPDNHSATNSPDRITVLGSLVMTLYDM
jgi:hypothetical protein